MTATDAHVDTDALKESNPLGIARRVDGELRLPLMPVT